jgi:arylsulfatase A-like enzyme
MKLSQGHHGTIVNGISRIGFMSGGKAARWVDEDMARTLTAKASGFIERNRARPFFLYLATHDIHVPRVPHGDFRGKSQCGLRCDAVQQFDYCVGQVASALARHGIAEETLLIVTSDNGPVVDDGYADGSVEALGSHRPAGRLRGGKYTVWEGGTRMPFIASWPARIKPKVSGALIGQVDLLATLGALAGLKPAEDAGPDSFNMAAALTGDSERGRESLVEQGGGLGLRRGQWKLVPAGESRGGAGGATGNTAATELFDLASDIGETKNVAGEHPGVVKEMSALLERVRGAGRSRPPR